MKTLTISSIGEITLGIKTFPGEFYGDRYIQINTQSRPDTSRVYLVRKNPPETENDILYDAGIMHTNDNVLFVIKPQNSEKNIFLILLKREEFQNPNGYVNILYGEEEDLAYRLLLAEEGSEFEICDPEDNWVTVKITLPQKITDKAR